MSYYDPPEPCNVYCEYCSDEIDTESSFISENAGAGDVHYFCNEDCQAAYTEGEPLTNDLPERARGENNRTISN